MDVDYFDVAFELFELFVPGLSLVEAKNFVQNRKLIYETWLPEW